MIVTSRRTLWLFTIALLLPLMVVTGAGWGRAAGQGTTAYVVEQQQPPASGSTPSGPQYQVVIPAPGTGTTVIQPQAPASGSGASTPPDQLLIPGPNPAQNTGVGQGEQLSTPGNQVTVYPTPGQ